MAGFGFAILRAMQQHKLTLSLFLSQPQEIQGYIYAYMCHVCVCVCVYLVKEVGT